MSRALETANLKSGGLASQLSTLTNEFQLILLPHVTTTLQLLPSNIGHSVWIIENDDKLVKWPWKCRFFCLMRTVTPTPDSTLERNFSYFYSWFSQLYNKVNILSRQTIMTILSRFFVKFSVFKKGLLCTCIRLLHYSSSLPRLHLPAQFLTLSM